VVDKFLMQLDEQLAEKKVEAQFTQPLKEHLAKKGFDPLMGARPMARLIPSARCWSSATITALQELDRKKDEFLSVASHELRTPLTTIKGYTQLLAQTVNDLEPEERATYINAVLGEIERMMGLISELLDVSRIETNRLQIHPQPIRWLHFIEGRISAFRVQHPARSMSFDVSAPESVVVADPDRMRQVVDNLLSNALKYSPRGATSTYTWPPRTASSPPRSPITGSASRRTRSRSSSNASTVPATSPAATTAASASASTSPAPSSKPTAARSPSRAKKGQARCSRCGCRGRTERFRREPPLTLTLSPPR